MLRKMTATIIIVIFLALLILAIIGLSSSMKLDMQNYLLDGFSNLSGLKIIHLSDLHYPNNGVELSEIIDNVSSYSPHLIILSGDTFDKSAERKDVIDLQPFFNNLSSIAPTFAVIGNHEIGSAILDDFIALSQTGGGIKLLNNEIVYYDYNGTSIAIIGLKDAFNYSIKNLPSLSSVSDSVPKILLAHRPEKFENYILDSNRPDLIFTGHAHGGQIRIFGKGIYSPNQGFFPKYTEGQYKKNDCSMFVSRGLGDSASNLRLFNSYQIITVGIA
ncbi:hypothetical protein EOM82_06700 [bacterium]|nr:hypothetical protein [bacterium]